MYNPRSRIYTYKSKQSKSKYITTVYGRSRSHPDLVKQRNRWYKHNIKIVPKDVNITPKGLMLWYLGDGCLHNRTNVVLCTDSFSEEEVGYLVDKLILLGIPCGIRHHCKTPRISILQKGIRPFFSYMGWKSPIKCYDYKFNIPYNLRYLIQTSEVTKLLGCTSSFVHHFKKNNFPNKKKSVNGSLWWNKDEIKILNDSYSHQDRGYATSDRDMSKPG